MTIVDLSVVWEEGMAANESMHPRAPLGIPFLRTWFTRHYLADVWRTNGAPPAYDGLPADWVSPDTQRGYQDEAILMNGHLGTHIDAATHFNPESKEDAAAIPLDGCIGTAVLLDFRHLGKVPLEPFKITVPDIEKAEERAGVKVSNGDIVILHTGWMAAWGIGPNASRDRYGIYLNPGLDIDAPLWFIERGVKLVGGDMPNIDHDMTSTGHINWLCREAAGKDPIHIVENLAHLENVPVPRFFFIGLPLPIRTATGSPIRAVAVIDQQFV